MSSLYDTGIRPKIDEYLKKKSEEQRDYGQYWSASSGGYCMRLNIMRRLGVPKVPELEDNATQTRIFEAGHIFHEWLQRITKDAGLSIASEVELQDEDLMIRGHFDDLILIADPSKTTVELTKTPKGITKAKIDEQARLILYDYKTAHSASFNYKKKQTEIGHYHKMQLGTYMYMLRNSDYDWGDDKADKYKHIRPLKAYTDENLKIHFLKDLSEARILSISKDDLRMHEQQLIWSPQLEKEILGYWTTLNRYWKERKLPPCTCLEHDGGFMGRKSAKGKFYNDFFYNEEPCSLEWYKLWKEGKHETVQA